MRSFKTGVVVLSLCAATLVGAGKNGGIRHHSHAALDDDIITTIVNALVDLESRISLPPG